MEHYLPLALLIPVRVRVRVWYFMEYYDILNNVQVM